MGRLFEALLVAVAFLPGLVTAQSGWEVLNSGTSVQLNAVFLLNADTGFVAGDGGTVLVTEDGGQSWQPLNTGTGTNLLDLYFFDRLHGLVIGGQGLVLRTEDGGQTWTQANTGVLDNLLAVSFAPGGNGIIGGLSQTLLYSSDSGRTWQTSQTGFFGGGFWGAQMLSDQDAVVGGENSIFQPMLGLSNDGGITWNFLPFYFNNSEGRILDVFFLSPQIGFAVGRLFNFTGAIARTSDGGANWTTLQFSQPVQAICFPDSLHGFAVGDGGQVLSTRDGGATWQLENPVSANLTDVAFVDTLAGFAVGQAGTIIRTRSGGIPVSLPDPPEPPIRNFALLGNFPNPFNPETEIHYQVAAAGQVEFRLVDLNGRLVRRWTEHPATAGRYRLHWDGTDQQGRPVASGVYLLSMQAGPFLQTIKMTLVR